MNLPELEEVRTEKVSCVRNKRKISRVHALIVFDKPVSKDYVNYILSFFHWGHSYNFLIIARYMWFLKLYYKAYYLFPDRRKILIVFAQPARERFSSYILKMQIEEICSIINRHLVTS
jgi:hypothetical protein